MYTVARQPPAHDLYQGPAVPVALPAYGYRGTAFLSIRWCTIPVERHTSGNSHDHQPVNNSMNDATNDIRDNPGKEAPDKSMSSKELYFRLLKYVYPHRKYFIFSILGPLAYETT